jgi:hypothetical protein
MKTTLPVRNLMNRSPFRAFFLIPFVLACFALSPQARAVCQEGCLTNQNTVLGEDVLLNNTGSGNTAIGDGALQNNTTGFSNTATGSGALYSNTTGNNNTATGLNALYSNTTGEVNTAVGEFALYSNTIGTYNTATGGGLFNNTTGTRNTATGVFALYSNTTGGDNTATGLNALYYNTGSGNIALGSNAGINLTTGNYNIDIGNKGVSGESRTIRIGTRQTHGATFIAGISGATVPTGVAVIVDASGHLGTTTSSARFKEAIKPMDKASEAILTLKPVTFRYKPDPEGIPQFGLVAEDVEKVNPALVARDADGKVYTVRYDAVNAMLLNEFLKEHRKVEEQEAMIAELKSTVAQQQKESRSTAAQQQNEIKALAATVKEQAAKIDKVNAKVELTKPAPQMVVNDQ